MAGIFEWLGYLDRWGVLGLVPQTNVAESAFRDSYCAGIRGFLLSQYLGNFAAASWAVRGAVHVS